MLAGHSQAERVHIKLTDLGERGGESDPKEQVWRPKRARRSICVSPLSGSARAAHFESRSMCIEGNRAAAARDAARGRATRRAVNN
jgi:hypothetical protein